MTDAQLPFRRGDYVGDAPLPLDGDAEVGLVANFIVEIVEVLQLGDDLAHHRLLHRPQAAGIGERIDVGVRDGADAVDVVRDVYRAELPHRVPVERAEQIHLDHHTAPAGV